MGEIFSRGKLILMGEYAVMDGATALCIPLQTGQQLLYDETGDKMIHWSWTYNEKLIARFSLDALSLRSTGYEDKGDAGWATRLIQQIRIQNRNFLSGGAILEFKNHFPVEWGLGSSSATISSLCRLAEADPYRVNQRLTGGSGADIAAAVADKWFFYQRFPEPRTDEIETDFQHKEHVFFIYSGKKQATARHIASISRKLPDEILEKAEEYARIFASGTLEEVMLAVQEHEKMLADQLGLPSRAGSFKDFDGKIKSLGAWGGDFFMAITPHDPDYVREYFKKRGFEIVLQWEEMTEERKF
jgi:mevalonate kinase